MKKIILLILAILLSACSSLTPEPTPTFAPTKTVTPMSASTPELVATPVPAASPEMQEYLHAVFLILDDISAAGGELDGLFFLASDDLELLVDDDWLKLANDALGRMAKGADELNAIAPVPVQAEKAHEIFKLAAEELRMVVLYQNEVIQGNFDSAYNVTEHMQAHLNYVEQAFEEIENIQP